ncbi:MAG: hypothetical protein ACOYMR_03540 [Ilumatobacteraceae bacterium]
MSELDHPAGGSYSDLEQILGYRGAIDPREGMTKVADEIYTVPFWTPAFCATVIRAAEAAGAFEPQPEDPVPGHEISLAIISPLLFEAVQQDLGMRIWPQLRQAWPYIDYHGLRDVFVIKYEKGGQESLRMHHDVAQVSGSVKLNEGYEGAMLDFPRQGIDNADVPVGELIVWPSLVTHPHQATPLVRGVKYGLTVWFELPTF